MRHIFAGFFFASLSLMAEPELMKPKWSGDLRYRHEWIHSEGSAVPSYHQHRIMFRTGAKVAVHEAADVDFRIATGPGRVSTNDTMDGGFANLGIGLDRAYFAWKPATGLSVLGGRVKNTFFTPSGSDLVWDTDMNFDGLSITYSDADSEFKPYLTGTFYWVNKVTTADKMDNHLIGLQAGGSTKVSGASMAAGVAFYQYTNMTTQTSIDGTTTAANFKGNTSAGAGATATYGSNFNVINPGVEVVFGDAPFTLTGDVAWNPAASTDNVGFLIGLAMGEAKKKGDWRLAYDYRQLKADATVAAFSDGDSFVTGGTDAKGHRVRVTYRILDPLAFAATAFIGGKNISAGATSVDRHKFHADLTWSF